MNNEDRLEALFDRMDTIEKENDRKRNNFRPTNIKKDGINHIFPKFFISYLMIFAGILIMIVVSIQMGIAHGRKLQMDKNNIIIIKQQKEINTKNTELKNINKLLLQSRQELRGIMLKKIKED